MTALCVQDPHYGTNFKYIEIEITNIFMFELDKGDGGMPRDLPLCHKRASGPSRLRNELNGIDATPRLQY